MTSTQTSLIAQMRVDQEAFEARQAKFLQSSGAFAYLAKHGAITGTSLTDTGVEHGPTRPTFAERFPESTHILDGVEVHCTGPNHDAVMWMSDWSRWPELKAAGLLRVEYGGPDTYGHDTLYVVA